MFLTLMYRDPGFTITEAVVIVAMVAATLAACAPAAIEVFGTNNLTLRSINCFRNIRILGSPTRSSAIITPTVGCWVDMNSELSWFNMGIVGHWMFMKLTDRKISGSEELAMLLIRERQNHRNRYFSIRGRMKVECLTATGRSRSLGDRLSYG